MPARRGHNLAVNPDPAPRLRGLHVVSVLARNWEVTEQPDAKTVWAQFPLTGQYYESKRDHAAR
jgi:hypothetical protein